jgi:hypothetical protein
MGGLVQHGEDVIALQEWIIRQDFLVRGSRAKQFKHVGTRIRKPRMQGRPPHLQGFNGDAIQGFEVQGIPSIRS